MENMLYMNFLALATLAVLMVIIRLNQEEMQRQIDGLRRRAHAI